ncbi:G_PROTEIN_RECEP_F1_2 domain-containing protein [Meloidogyne graminicola]|uniref:G_PROTEIN_RECEP_F1_2 domain-containing protein n=1 Tax=Meloidogyne graminicola TaxID=189291 RepID=A0A8T0A198_9BILA|nr:G_PROTEIN_RECEP_F1_2 domain-containing protein [Meloidogyne graminicola]
MTSIMSTVVRMSLIMSFAIFGNIFLIFVIQKGNNISKSRISPVQLLILHTCFADLLFALLSLGSEIGILLTFPKFYASDFVCRLVRYLQVLPLYASPFLMVAISIDRYQAICRPLVHYTSDRFRRPNYFGLFAWLLALFCSIPQLFIWQKMSIGKINNNNTSIIKLNLGDENEMKEQCRSIYGTDPDIWKQAYVLWFSIIAWLLPSLISAFFYFKICSTVWKLPFWQIQQVDEINNVKTQKITSSIDASCQLTREYVEVLRKSSTGFQNQMTEFDKKRIKTVRLTLIINNKLPFCAINVLQAFAYKWAWGSGQTIITQIAILGNLNACKNYKKSIEEKFFFVKKN